MFTTDQMLHLKRLRDYVIMKGNMIPAFVAAVQTRANYFTHWIKISKPKHLTDSKTQIPKQNMVAIY